MEYKIASRSVISDDGISHQFHYHLVVETVSTAHFCCELYGIHITDERGYGATRQCITTSPTKIDELLSLLVDHSVSPANLDDVVSDWLEEEKCGTGTFSGAAV